MYGLFLVDGKKHFLRQIHGPFQLLPTVGKTLGGQGFPPFVGCDLGAAVTIPQSAEFCTCTAGDGAGVSPGAEQRHAQRLRRLPCSFMFLGFLMADG